MSNEESHHPTTAADTESSAANESQSQPQEQAQETAEGKPRAEPGSAFLGGYGNFVGDKVSTGLSPVGKPLGKGLETVASPVGGVVEPVMGGVMKFGQGFGDQVGVGAGNQDQKKLEEMREAEKPVGGQEQTGGNPLGLSNP